MYGVHVWDTYFQSTCESDYSEKMGSDDFLDNLRKSGVTGETDGLASNPKRVAIFVWN